MAAKPAPDSAMSVDIDIVDPLWDSVSDVRTVVERAVAAALDCLEASDALGPVAVRLSNDREVQELNRTFRGKDAPTNVLSFPAPENANSGHFPDEPSMGDIILALETVRREAEIDGKKFESHVAHLVIHGVLHLAGFDHEEHEDAEEMESLEIEVLRRLGIDNPYT